MIDLLLGPDNIRSGANPPKPGSNNDYVIARLAEAVPEAEPFPVDETVPVKAGDLLIVITAHPAGVEREIDAHVPVAQSVTVRRAPKSRPRHRSIAPTAMPRARRPAAFTWRGSMGGWCFAASPSPAGPGRTPGFGARPTTRSAAASRPHSGSTPASWRQEKASPAINSSPPVAFAVQRRRLL